MQVALTAYLLQYFYLIDYYFLGNMPVASQDKIVNN
jgi:hypothetical protein